MANKKDEVTEDKVPSWALFSKGSLRVVIACNEVSSVCEIPDGGCTISLRGSDCSFRVDGDIEEVSHQLGAPMMKDRDALVVEQIADAAIQRETWNSAIDVAAKECGYQSLAGGKREVHEEYRRGCNDCLKAVSKLRDDK